MGTRMKGKAAMVGVLAIVLMGMLIASGGASEGEVNELPDYSIYDGYR